ncbi:hypothetical protein MNBD_BACTEROID07-939 [hydrothermal vent metagenome]|uniref:Uncharacterized protein n=1 Tax=hydrothermal vent metagenome TaxID=652676 RepID=A0A3B0UH20_9ZZZZ
MKAQDFNKLFDAVIAAYHIKDSVDQAFNNPHPKKNLLAFRRRNTMLLPVLFSVVLVPLKPGAFQQEVEYVH